MHTNIFSYFHQSARSLLCLLDRNVVFFRSFLFNVELLNLLLKLVVLNGDSLEQYLNQDSIFAFKQIFFLVIYNKFCRPMNCLNYSMEFNVQHKTTYILSSLSNLISHNLTSFYF